MNDFTHFNESGRAKMVDVSEKAETSRTAVAAGRVRMNRETFELVKTGGMKKGDVLGAAQIAGIMAAKRTPDLIPMCHTLLISGVDMAFELNDADCAVDITATVKKEQSTAYQGEGPVLYVSRIAPAEKPKNEVVGF